MRTDQALAAGTTLRGGHYTLNGVLGAGGFGIVYAATTKDRKPVAIKELFPDRAERRTVFGLWTRKAVKPTKGWADLERRMRDEFRTIRTLKHPHIVRVVELFGENGTLYLVMERLVGETLHDRLLRFPDGLPQREAVQTAAALADALGYAHKKGVLHRDVKPGNVIVTKSGRPVLLDFGLAGPLNLAGPRTVSGTDAYMAPEQVRGETQGVPTDVYGLAATVYHLVTGVPPQGAADRLRADHLTPPADERSAVTAALSDAVMRALKLDPARRTPTCAAFLADLSGVEAVLVVERPRESRWGWARGLLVAAGLGVLAAAWSGCPAGGPGVGAVPR